MEKKVAVVLIFAILLGFWSVTLLFFIGNPFAETQGTYRYSVSDVSVSVPLDWAHDLMSILNYQNRVQLSPTYSPITVHVGNFTTNLAGKNWDLFITRLANIIVGYTVLNNVTSEIRLPITWQLNSAATTLLIIGLLIGYGLTFVPRIYRRVRRKQA